MNIAVLVHAFPVISETFILRQITGLLDRGHDVKIYAGERGTKGLTHPAVASYKLERLAQYMPWVREDYHRHTREEYLKWLPDPRNPLKFDVIHCHFGPMGITGLALRAERVFEGKIVTSFYGFDVDSFVRAEGSDVYRQLFLEGDWFTADSTHIASKVMKLGCSSDKIDVLPVGLDLEVYRGEPLNDDRSTPLKLLTVGRLVEKKGIEFGIRAVAELSKRGLTVEYNIIGDGPLRKELETLIFQLGLGQTVRLLGYQTEDVILDAYRATSIFMLPSVTARNGDEEGLGLVLLEAQAMGLPVVATRHNGFPESVVDGRTGFLVPERDPVSLADRLMYLIQHPESRRAFGEAGRMHVQTNFNIDKLNDRLIEMFRSA